MNTAQRRATAALWSIQGVGPVTLEEIPKKAGAPVGELLDRPIASWSGAVEWRGSAAERVSALSTLAERADWLEHRCRVSSTQIIFSGDPAWPDALDRLIDAPPLLFLQGPGAFAPRRRRLAIVGSRGAPPHLRDRIKAVASEAAADGGLGIVSGAAEGVDEAVHRGALEVRGETWAFMGSALDQIDSGRCDLARDIRDQGGSLFSEMPPGARANMNSFKLRNRLIAGASDAVLVFLAKVTSGSLYTADAAFALGRTVLVTPFDGWSEAALGGNQLLRNGKAQPHLDLSDLIAGVGLEGARESKPTSVPFNRELLSPHGRLIFDQVMNGPIDFEGLCAVLPALSAAQLSAALVELEVVGAVLHKGARRYEKR
ncbi:MAG: DNA-processing protein DprA [Archangium sp.]